MATLILDGLAQKTDGGVARRSALELLESLPGRRLFKTSAEADEYLREEREAWERQEALRQRSLRFWLFKNKVVEVDGWEAVSREEVLVLVKHKVLSEDENFSRLKREIELFESPTKSQPCQREPIPEDVRMFVWRRDNGRCVKCGSQERIEFDHIIPVACGGSNTARNIQVLCERCNREKGKTI